MWKMERLPVISDVIRPTVNRWRFIRWRNGKHAVTHYKVLESLGYLSLIECRLETGRTHQIRVHMKHIGHPLFNDETYGGKKILKGTTFSQIQNIC